MLASCIYIYMKFHPPALIIEVPISVDALRMRTRRLCEKKPSGKTQVDQTVIDQYKQGGEHREVLEMALLEALGRFGLDRSQYKRVKARII